MLLARFMAPLAATALLLAVCAPLTAGEPTLKAGLAKADITPDVQGQTPVWIAGYGQNRRATGVHDPLYCRAAVLDDGERKIALACVDLVGLQYPEVQRIRAQLADFAYVMVSSSHNHEGPDVVGLWGPTPVTSGVDPKYIDRVVEQTVQAIRAAEKAAKPVSARYGTSRDESLLKDGRLPIVFDGVLRALRFDDAQGKPAGLVVQWNCHPEALGPKNTEITADFLWSTAAELEKKYGCPVVLLTGAVGGLMTNPASILDEQGAELKDEQFPFAELLGQRVAKLAEQAVDGASSLELTPFKVSARPIAIPLANKLYVAARAIGVLPRPALEWTGDFEKLGPVATATTPVDKLAIATEVAYLRLGDLHVACIPGELYTELVYGQFQEPVEANVDYPSAPLEPAVMATLPGEKTMLIGLANDEVGYIIPKRQWDQAAPYAYGRQESQYGEINSCGPDVAPVLMEALVRRVREAQAP
jgi:hypothetical protein